MRKNRFDYKKILPLTALVLASCGDTSDGVGPSKASQENGGGQNPEGAGVPTVAYLNSRNSNAPIVLQENSSFPAGALGSVAAGTFNQRGLCDNSYVLNFDFTITNSGTGPLVGVGSAPYVSIEDTTAYGSGYGAPADYQWTIISAPSFPIAPGASTSFTVEFSKLSTVGLHCRYGELELAFNSSRARFDLKINTDSISVPDFETELVIWGHS